MEGAGILHAGSGELAVPALLPGRGADLLRGGHGRAGEPGASLGHRTCLSVRAAVAGSRPPGGRSARAVRAAAVLVAVPADRILQLPRRAAVAPLGARPGSAGRAGPEAVAHDPAGGRGRGALLPAPLRVPALRPRRPGRLARARPPAACPPLDDPDRRARPRIPGHEPGGASSGGGMDAACARALRTAEPGAARPSQRIARHLARIARRDRPLRPARRGGMDLLAAAPRGGPALFRLSRRHRLAVAAQRAVRGRLRALRHAAVAAGARAARSPAPAARRRSRALRVRRRRLAGPRLHARGGRLRPRSRRRRARPASPVPRLRLRFGLGEVQPLSPLRQLLPRP